MPILTDAEHEWMRATILDTTLPDTGDILEVTYTVDGQGGVTSSWGTATEDVAYRLDLKTGNEQVTGGALKPFSYWQLTLPYDATVTTDNRFQDKDGNLYNISSIDADISYHMCTICTVEAV